MRFLFILFCATHLITVAAQSDSTNVAHNYEFSLSVADNPSLEFNHAMVIPWSEYTIAKGGTALGLTASYSLSVRKWFFDGNLHFRYKYLAYQVLFDATDARSVDLKSNLFFFNPSLSVGRFFRPADSFRMSFSLSAGYNILLSKKVKPFFIRQIIEEDTYEFYEGTIQPYLNKPLTLSASIGFYIPVQKNELCIKFFAGTNSFTNAHIQMSKIENYTPVLIIDETNGPSTYLFGVSLGYRFNQFNPTH